MAENRQRFAELLTVAVKTINLRTGRSLAAIQDDLGHALHRSGSDYLHYLRKGHVPAILDDIERLACLLAEQGGFPDDGAIENFLRAAGHPQVSEFVAGIQQTAVDAMAVPNYQPLSTLKPFVFGPPITHPRQFFGRTRELRRIYDWWRAWPLEHVAIVGPRRSGKTSLLHYVRQLPTAGDADLRPGQRPQQLTGFGELRWIMVDFQIARLRTLTGLLSHMIVGFDLPAETSLTLDNVVEAIQDTRLDTRTVVCLDALDVALRDGPELDQRFWWGIRALLNGSQGGNLAFLTASQIPPDLLALECGQTSPLFNMFHTQYLDPFTQEEAEALIAASPIPFAAADVAWILTESGRQPALLQILCQERLSALERGETDESWKAEAISQMIPLRYFLE
jgi:hypothetical protein